MNSFNKRITFVFCVSTMLIQIISGMLAASNQPYDQNLKELIDARSFSKSAGGLLEKEIIKFGGTALLLTFCKKLGDPKFGQKFGLEYDKKNGRITTPIAFMVLIGLLATLWPTISEMYFIGKDQPCSSLKNLTQYISSLDSKQRTQLECIQRSIQKEFAVTTLIDVVMLPLLFYFCFFNSDTDDYNKTFAIMYGLVSTIGAAAIRYISL
jgi:hypothetical protein